MANATTEEAEVTVSGGRWATYGSVTDQNAQPHEVECRIHLVGAHNGNLSVDRIFVREMNDPRFRVRGQERVAQPRLVRGVG